MSGKERKNKLVHHPSGATANPEHPLQEEMEVLKGQQEMEHLLGLVQLGNIFLQMQTLGVQSCLELLGVSGIQI